MSFRTKGKDALASVLNIPKNITILENAVYECVAEGRVSVAHQGKETEHNYKSIIYQVVSDIQNGNSIKDIYRSIRDGGIGWKHKSFQTMRQRIQEQNEFIENPFEVEEGVHTCRKCGSKRVFSYNKQCMGSDEGTSVFCECAACHCKWKEKG